MIASRRSDRDEVVIAPITLKMCHPSLFSMYSQKGKKIGIIMYTRNIGCANVKRIVHSILQI